MISTPRQNGLSEHMAAILLALDATTGSGTSLVEKATAAVADAMIEHGPDGHCDGADLIARAALEAIGLPALLERVEAAEGEVARLTSEWDEDELNQHIERLRGSVSSMFHEIELVRHERNTARADRDALAAKVARVEALAEDWQQHHDERSPDAPSLIYGDGAKLIRHTLRATLAANDTGVTIAPANAAHANVAPLSTTPDDSDTP